MKINKKFQKYTKKIHYLFFNNYDDSKNLSEKTKDLFPELPRKLLAYIRFKAEQEMQNLISEEELDKFKEKF